MLEPLDDLVVAELQDPPAHVDHGHLGAERGEHGGVLHADDAAPHHHQCARDAVHVDQSVGVEDGPVVELHGRGPGRPGAGGDDDVLGGDLPLATVVPFDQQGVRIDEAPGPFQQGDVVADQLVPDHVDLPADDVRGPAAEVLDGDVLLHPVALAVDAALAEPGEVQHGFAERLRGDGSGHHADPAHLASLDDGRSPAELRRLDGGLLSRRSATDHQEVELVGHRSSFSGTPSA